MRIQKWLARIWPRYFSYLYSTLNEPAIVPVQAAAYKLVLERYLSPKDRVLDVGFGLGYGLEILSAGSAKLTGIDIDARAVANGQRLMGTLERLEAIHEYDGKIIPYSDKTFNLVTCIDVLEHVSDYLGLLNEMVRVSQRIVLVSTPNRRPESTRLNGRPRNPWHLREWSYDEYNTILQGLSGVKVLWHFINGPWEGPFNITNTLREDTLALSPVLLVE